MRMKLEVIDMNSNLSFLILIFVWAIGFTTIGYLIGISKPNVEKKINKKIKKIVDKGNTKVIYLKYK